MERTLFKADILPIFSEEITDIRPVYPSGVFLSYKNDIDAIYIPSRKEIHRYRNIENTVAVFAKGNITVGVYLNDSSVVIYDLKDKRRRFKCRSVYVDNSIFVLKSEELLLLSDDLELVDSIQLPRLITEPVKQFAVHKQQILVDSTDQLIVIDLISGEHEIFSGYGLSDDLRNIVRIERNETGYRVIAYDLDMRRTGETEIAAEGRPMIVSEYVAFVKDLTLKVADLRSDRFAIVNNIDKACAIEEGHIVASRPRQRVIGINARQFIDLLPSEGIFEVDVSSEDIIYAACGAL